MSRKRADQLAGMARVFERKGWGRGGYDGGAGVPCMQNAADEVGLPHSYLTRRGRDCRWNDKQRSRSAVIRELRRMAEQEREGVVRQAQKDAKAAQAQADKQAKQQAAKDAHQQPCANPVAGSGSRTVAPKVLAGIAVVAVIVMAVHLVALLLMVLYVLLLVAAFAAAAWVLHAVLPPVIEWISEQNWGHVKVWRANRQAARTALDARRVELAEEIELARQPIALGPPPARTLHDTLMHDWADPARAVPEPVRRTKK